jgi:HNH endonuclease
VNVAAELQQAVEQRAGERCEYCRIHQALQGATFHVEHVVPRAKGGGSGLDNLALACPGCNLHKSDRVEAPDPQTGNSYPLFNPRSHRWSEHFRWQQYQVMPLTPTGRATAAALNLNHPRRVRIRRAEELFALFPPA